MTLAKLPTIHHCTALENLKNAAIEAQQSVIDLRVKKEPSYYVLLLQLDRGGWTDTHNKEKKLFAEFHIILFDSPCTITFGVARLLL